MNKILEERLNHYRRKEDIIKNVEETEAKTNEAIRLKLKSPRKSIGPANDLLRFFYTLEQHYQNDSNEIRAKAREDVMNYISQYRQPDDDDDDVEQEEENNTDQTSDDLQPTPIVPINSQSQSTTITSSSSQPLLFTSFSSQSPLFTSSSSQSPLFTSSQPTTTTSSQPTTITSSPSQSSLSNDSENLSLAPVTDSSHIKPDTLENYNKLLSKAHQYEEYYKTIDSTRKKQLVSYIRGILNKLRIDTFKTLTNELLHYLNGQEQKVSNQTVRIMNNNERLLCLSTLAKLIFAQLLDGDLNDIKTEIFLPLIGIVSENKQHTEFSTIFRDHLHKKCPYTVPFYPKREATMSDEQYLEVMGYNKRQEGNQNRLETETEFLNRMSGLIRLFCKLLIRRSAPFDNDLSYAWKWFSDVLNLPPRPNITALLIRVFLDEAGDSMLEKYSDQFGKIIKVIRTSYLTKLKQETSDDQMARLQLTLEKFLKKI